jgi:hypothetical protein
MERDFWSSSLQNIAQDDSVFRILDLILNTWHFTSLQELALPFGLCEAKLTHIYANKQTDEDCVQTSDQCSHPLPECRPLPSNRLSVMMTSQRDILAGRYTDMTLAWMFEIKFISSHCRCIRRAMTCRRGLRHGSGQCSRALGRRWLCNRW